MNFSQHSWNDLNYSERSKLVNILIVDALASNEGRRMFSRDAIGVGPRLIAGICEKNDKYSRIFRAEDLLENNFNIKDFDVFLISAMTVDKIAVKRVIQKIRKEIKDSVLILGGPILSDKNIVKNLNVNLGVIGEGELILDYLLKNDFSFNSISNNLHEDIEIEHIDSSLILNQKYHSNKDIFSIFHPSTKHIKDYPDYWFSKVYVETIRGCSNHYRGDIVKKQGGCSDCGNCSNPEIITNGDCPEDIPPGCGFCSVPSTFGSPKSRDMNLIVNEVEELLRKGVRRIILSAPGFLDYNRNLGEEQIFSPINPPINVENIQKLLSKLAKIRENQNHRCSISIENVKPSLVTEEISKVIGEHLPNTSISIGCETFDEVHSNQIGRPSSPSKAIEAAKLLSKNGLFPQIYLIHSLPGETAQSLNYTKKIVENDLYDFVEKITVYKYLPLPNSPFTVTQTPFPTERHLIKLQRKALKNTIIDFNFNKKQTLINSSIISIVSERDRVRKKTFICYPLYSGPAISVESEEPIIGKVAEIKIKEVISDKLVFGEIEKIIE